MTRVTALALGAALASSSCAREGRDGAGMTWVGQRGPESFEGQVRVVGSEPFSRAVIDPGEGEPTFIVGAYRGEIRRLSGAEVEVTGRFVTGELPGRTLEASSYEILSVDGDRPVIGRLERDERGFRLEGRGGEAVRLSTVSEPLAQRVGALVWVVLDELGGVARYGVLREAT